MNRRMLLGLAALALALAWGTAPGARADRLGGNYRGPGDLYVLREDAKKTAPEAGDAGGASGSGSTPSSEGSGEGDGSTGEPAEGTSSGDSGSGEDQPPPPHGGEYRGPAGEGDGGEGSGEPPPS
ncbi:MAG: hypothetical protein HUU06_10920, partial [Planctomycetaceae bacterium]|nr:hypothetical protein [Planctomycetaceae bacterium]